MLPLPSNCWHFSSSSMRRVVSCASLLAHDFTAPFESLGSVSFDDKRFLEEDVQLHVEGNEKRLCL